ncbi:MULTISPECIES: phage tail protein [Xenorhabdus]|uniref:Tail fiber-like repeat protein n=1 Tax=Xenorhabdus ehlersii TaxID=290111 RepID=A0A2D0ITY3_9GAMM|nr:MULTISPECIES: phage tail protein [Xenorhabdus]MBC8948828.1 tail protein [Xenorhabdus sp. TS4]PHM25340.1 tail protein [Xenorhabdus ehlersii]RKE90471.1 tail fiber-like repeat protein [Xenorhabdus ehlersii]
MSTEYFALLTQAGTEKLEKAASSGIKLEITHMAVGDGGGSSPTPNVNQSGLINEKHRAELDALLINPQTPAQVIAEQILPEGEGNWWVREIGLFDKDGTLIAVGNCAELYKPESQEQAIRMALTVNNSGLTGWIKELLSGFASRSYVREKIKEHAESRDHPSATLGKRGFVALSNEVGSDSEVHAATPKAVKIAYELANQANESVNSILSTNKYVPSTRKVNGKELSKDIELTATDVGAYDKIQTDSLVDRVSQTANKALDQVSTKVPLSRKINGKELISDIGITAHDVNAYTRQEVDGLIANVDKSANTANENANEALKQLDKKVPLSRKINNKELLIDIQLTANDVGTYDKKEIDDRINTVQQATDTANNNANTAIQELSKKVPESRKINNKELTTDIELGAADVGTYNKVEIDDRIGNVEKLAETANNNANTAIQDAKNKVPESRKINGKELLSDIELRAVDVGAYGKEETDAIIKDVKVQIDNVNNLAENANNNANTATQDAKSKVPLTRKVNGKELSADIQLTAADIDTYNKAEIDDRVSKVDKLAETANQQANDALQRVNNSVPSTRKVNGKELLTDIELSAADVDTYNKAEIDDRVGKVDKLAESAYNNANTAIKDANSKVPLTRKVNGKELSTDVQLTAADIDTYNKAEIDDRVSKVDKLAETANQQANAALNSADNKVPLSRKVNGKELSADVQLTAADIDTYNKAEIDDRVGKVDKLAETANNNANIAIQAAKDKVPSTRKVNGKELITDIELTASDIHAYNKKETDDLINGVKAQVDNVQQLANTANNNASLAIQELDKKVPESRKINGKELSADIQLTAADVDAYNKGETDAQIKDVKSLADTANQHANDALKGVSNSVPSTLKVNGKELLTDIELTAADVGTYNKVEIDDRIGKVDKLAESAYNKAETASKDANNKVPSTRKVNGKELLTDIELHAVDVGTYNKAELDDSIGKVEKLADAANQTANSAVQLADSKVPLTRKINGKELSTDIELTAANVDTYNKAEINILIDEVKETANNAHNTAEHKVPLTRTVNGKALLSDIDLTASDVNAYTKVEVESRLEDIKGLANKANNNADSRVPLTRTVNGKALLSDIKLTASDVGAYSKVEVDTRISKVETLASDANTNAIAAKANADSRLAKSKNGADIPDKQAFVRNLGLGNLIGLGIESRRIIDEHTIIKLGEIFVINGVAVGSEPIGDSHAAEIGGVTYYTHFYKIKLPTTLPNGIISCQASVVGDNFDNQRPSYLADVKTQRGNANGDGLSKDTLTISITTPQLGWVPNFYYQVIGY